MYTLTLSKLNNAEEMNGVYLMLYYFFIILFPFFMLWENIM